MNSKALDWLTETLRRSFAHVGPRQARRMALQILQLDGERFRELLSSMQAVRERIHRCQVCQDLTESEHCLICKDTSRDSSVIAVVENPQDVAVLESARFFRGTYHVLYGNVDPASGGSASLGGWTLEELFARLQSPKPCILEVLLALDQDSEGELTSLYLAHEIQSRFSHIQVTRIGVGVPLGGEILYTDPTTLKRAIASRTPVESSLIQSKDD